MTLEELLKQNFLLLPKSIPVTENYRQFLYELFAEYLKLIKNLTPKEYNIRGLLKIKNFDNIYNIQKDFIEGLKNTIDMYFDGQPSNAYIKFDQILRERIKRYGKFLNEKEIQSSENFYRIRLKTENYPYNSLEMFHIPYELRGKVTTQRYSIPGFPSLYLSNNLYVAWEELNRPNLNTFQAIRLSNTKTFKVLDLTFSNIEKGILNMYAYKYLMTWPLIAACSLRVKNHADSFKPEYIMPQLLLQWIRNSNSLDGVIFSSTHIENEELIQENKLFNLVLPVRENKDNGHCNYLTELFELTETVSRELMDISSGWGDFIYNDFDNKEINKKLSKLEIIKGLSNPYNHSIIGKMEAKLNQMKTKKI